MSYIALLGPPNSGKTTLFNWLTGRKQKVVNYPGSTVDISIGEILPELSSSLTEPLHVMDTPGAYSLFPKSQDEEVTCQTLFDEKYSISKVVVVLDSTQIARQIHLVRQAQEIGLKVIVAITMHDLHIKEQSEVDVAKLSEMLSVPVLAIDGVLGGGVRELVAAIARLPDLSVAKKELEHWPLEKMQSVFKEGEKIVKIVTRKELSVFAETEGKDKLFLHPFFGPIIFIAVMVALFSSIYWAAAPLMDIVDLGFGIAVDNVKSALSGAGLFADLMSDGVVGGLGAVLIFVPQIFILFLGISILEDSGYLARAAAIVDKPLSKLGLNGKAFVPILSGFACAVPAMMAARSINSSKERWIAMFIIPFMTCSARLPVYALLIGFLFPHRPFMAGVLMASLYISAILIGAVAAGLLNKIIKTKTPSFFLLELPLYRRPQLKNVFRSSLKRTKAYIVKTGPIILVLSVFLWVLSTFPNYKEENESIRLSQSYVAHLGEGIEPMFKPLGVDWRVGVGLITAFAAREVFVSSLAVMFSVEGDDDDGLREGLIQQMKNAKNKQGEPIFTVASVSALLVFFMIALQCISTTATAKQEMRSSRFALIQLVSMNILAYLAAAITYGVMS